MLIKFKSSPKYANLLIVSLLALVFFVSTASFNYLAQGKDYIKWSSPDETANYFFAERLSTTGQLAYFDRANIIGDNLVMPRSVRSDSGWLKPVSFLGIILIYGSLAAIFGTVIIPFLTPFFAALGIILFYLIVRRLFSERVGLWSAFLLAGFPVYVYYTVRAMFHNVLFIVLLLAGIYFFLLALGAKKKSQIAAEEYDIPADEASTPKSFWRWSLPARQWWKIMAIFISGLFIGLALITRTSEFLWLAPCLFLIWIFYARRIGLTKTLIFIAGVFLALLPTAYYNQILYGSFMHGGYNEMNRSLDDLALSGGELLKSTWQSRLEYCRHFAGTIFRNVFYFGFKSEQSLEMAKRYILDMFPVLFYGGLSGLLILTVNNCFRFRKKHLVYVLCGLVSAVILVFYYGSWKFNDNPDPTRFTIGNSYTRYWLPIYLFLMPLTALVLIRTSNALLLISNKTKARVRRLIATGLQILVVTAFIFSSIFFVLFGSEEGLAYLYYNNQAEKINAQRIWGLTEPTAVIITRYYDKFFWPERRVIMSTIPETEVLSATAKLARYYPVYYYNFFWNEADVNYLNERKFSAYGLVLKLVEKTGTQFGLYKLELKNNVPANQENK